MSWYLKYRDVFNQENENNIIIVYDNNMNVNKYESVHVIPILKYLEIFVLFSEKFHFTCSKQLFDYAKEIFKYNSEKKLLLDRFSFKTYHELLEEEIKCNIMAILTQEDENDEKYNKSIRDLYMRFKKEKIKHKLIIFTDTKNFQISNQQTYLREYLRNENLINYVDLYNTAKNIFNSFFGINKQYDFPRNILIYQFLIFLDYLNKSNDFEYDIHTMFLETSTNYPESPIWLILNINFEDIINDVDIKEFKKKNFFMLLNMYNILEKDVEIKFFNNISKSIQHSFKNHLVRMKILNDLKKQKIKLIEDLKNKIREQNKSSYNIFSTLIWILSYYTDRKK